MLTTAETPCTLAAIAVDHSAPPKSACESLVTVAVSELSDKVPPLAMRLSMYADGQSTVDDFVPLSVTVMLAAN
jgi:hypothetical protein